MRGKRGFGKLGEDFAVKFLQNKGYKVIQRNFRSKLGEIDIVGQDDDTLVFVEVKSRWSRKYGKPEEAVGPKKLFRVRRMAEYYLLTHPGMPKKLRIDVVAIEIEGGKVTSAKIIKAC